MPYGSGSAAGDVAVARTGSRITGAMQPSAARGETSGPRPKRQRRRGRGVAVGSAGGAGAARSSRLALFPPAADIEPCMRFSRTRLPDVLRRWAFSVPVATAGWVVARRWFR